MRIQRRGVVLITALFVVLIVGIIARAILVSSPLRAREGYSEQATAAALSGVDYALCRLRAEPGWKGVANRMVVNSPGICVVESEGNVFGLIGHPGSYSQFRIRFNFQDGAGGADLLPDPPSDRQVKFPYLSVNNLQQAGDALVPRADTSGVVSDPTTGLYSVVGGSVCLVVEGRSGPGLASLSPSKPNANPVGAIFTRTVESIYQMSFNQPVNDAAIMAGGNLQVEVATGERVKMGTTDGTAPRLRSKKAVQVRHKIDGSPASLDAGGSAEVGRDAALPDSFVASPRPGTTLGLVDESVGDSKGFYQLSWDDIKRADPNPATDKAIIIPGGTYVLGSDGLTHYYDKTFAEYQTWMSDPANQSDPGLVVSQNLQELRSSSNLSKYPTTSDTGLKVGGRDFVVSGHDLAVVASNAGVSDLAILPEGGAEFVPGDSRMAIGGIQTKNLRRFAIKVKDSTLSLDGDLLLQGQVISKGGTITVGGDLNAVLLKAEMAAVDPSKSAPPIVDDTLNLYVKGDINISSYDKYHPNTQPAFSDMAYRGLYYCWGNVSAYLGHDSLQKKDWGNFNLTGSLVAYGSDPESGKPGSNGTGNIRIQTRSASLIWEPVGLGGVVAPDSSLTKLIRQRFNVF